MNSIFPFSWESSSQLTLTPSFFRGVGIPPSSFFFPSILTHSFHSNPNQSSWIHQWSTSSAGSPPRLYWSLDILFSFTTGFYDAGLLVLDLRRTSMNYLKLGTNGHQFRIVMRTDKHGYGSIPIDTIFSGMNIHLPAILMFTRGTRFWHTATCGGSQFFLFWYPLVNVLHRELERSTIFNG